MRTVLFLGCVWPEPVSSAAGVRTLSLVNTFLAAGWAVHFSAPNPENEFSRHLDALGVKTRVQGPNDSSFDAWISSLSPTVAIFDRFMTEEQFGWRVREHSPATLRVLDTIDLHFLRRAREAALKVGEPLERIFKADFPFFTPGTFGHDDAIREVSAIYRSDLTLLVSDFEQALLEKRFLTAPELLCRAPFFFPAAGPSPGFSDRKHFVSIGNFRHAPNADSVRWLRDEIWPLVRSALPEAEVHLYGAYPPRSIMELSGPGFIVKGPANDAVSTLQNYRVSLAPLRFGAGIKGKIADSWRAGLPTVTTPIGAEGMRFPDGSFAGAVTENVRDFVSAAVSLYSDEARWNSCHIDGTRALSSLFDERGNSAIFLNAIETAVREINHRRNRNFTGSMLNYHLHRSTTYMSRWIEEKNRIVRPKV